jgi:hypothetical protein
MPSPFPPPPLEKINNPFVWRAFDSNDRLISVSANWDSSGNGALMSMVLFREEGCAFSRVIIGGFEWQVPEGETLVRIGELRSNGFFSIVDIFMADITAL